MIGKSTAALALAAIMMTLGLIVPRPEGVPYFVLAAAFGVVAIAPQISSALRRRR